MKKLFLAYLLLIIPVLVLAQGESPVLKNNWKKVPGMSSSFKFNDHLGIMQVTLNDTSSELIALDNKMSVLWRKSFKGCGMACGKLKGNILAISDSGFSKTDNINPYYAYLVDSASGKIILQKKIFDQKARHSEQATAFFTPNGSDFNLIVRQADIHTGYLSSIKNKTEDLTLISLNEKLEPTYLKPKIPDEDFVALTMNKSGDFFLTTTRDEQSLETRRYERGSIEPSEPITLTCGGFDKPDLFAASEDIMPSETDRNILYLSIGHNDQNADREILTAKLNFATHQSQTTSEVFTHKHVREVEKSFVPFNDGIRKANLGSAKQQMRVKYLAEHNDKLISVSTEAYSITAYNVTTWYGFALVINCYDSNLKTLFQQVMPVEYSRGGGPLTTGYSFGQNDLKIVSKAGLYTAYGQLDLSTGKWLKLDLLSVNDGDPDKRIIWFNDNLIVPFLHQRSFSSKYNIDLSLIRY